MKQTFATLICAYASLLVLNPASTTVEAGPKNGGSKFCWKCKQTSSLYSDASEGDRTGLNSDNPYQNSLNAVSEVDGKQLQLVVQIDGNVVLYKDGEWLWDIGRGGQQFSDSTNAQGLSYEFSLTKPSNDRVTLQASSSLDHFKYWGVDLSQTDACLALQPDGKFSYMITLLSPTHPPQTAPSKIIEKLVMYDSNCEPLWSSETWHA